VGEGLGLKYNGDFLMDEYDRGMDPEVKRYFRKIMNSFSYGLLWMLFTMTTGLYFDLASIHNGIAWYNIVFYAIALTTFLGLVFYLYRVWSGKVDRES
jgi:Kef-type K+ transport system membrane component KefB